MEVIVGFFDEEVQIAEDGNAVARFLAGSEIEPLQAILVAQAERDEGELLEGVALDDLQVDFLQTLDIFH